MMLKPKVPLAYAISNSPGGFAGAQVLRWWRHLDHVAVEIRNFLAKPVDEKQRTTASAHHVVGIPLHCGN